MSDADAERRIHALRLMRAALDITDAARGAWLDEQCADDAALRAEVGQLLAADAADVGMLDEPLNDQIARGAIGADSRIGRRLGPYVLTELLGRGGMGVVYRGERTQGGFVQVVAVKLLRSGAHDESLAAQRFARERQILVRLQHPRIARLIDGGIDDNGQPWYAMEYVQGEALIDWATRTQASLRQRLHLLMQVCDAVHYAHQNLVLHRDLKPANILVDAAGDAKLLDFGIAKLLDDTALDEAEVPTRTEQRAFTPAYAAPEQIDGGAVSTATDIYALGVILYELLTGARPSRADHTEPPSRRMLRTGGDRHRAAPLRGDLDTITLTCLQVDPSRRYASVAALNRDIERHLSGLPIDARADAWSYRALKFLRRHRFAAATALLAGVTLIGATVFSLDQSRRAERERDAALDEARQQETLREHFVAVLNRAGERDTPIAPEELMKLAADPNLLGSFGDADTRIALQLALADLFAQRDDYQRTLDLLAPLAVALPSAPARLQSRAAEIRATALVRLGRLDDAGRDIDAAERLMTTEQHDGGMLPADLGMLRAQVLRARGSFAAAAVAARDAARRAHAATDGSALNRGRLIGSGATTLLFAGDLDGVVELTDLAAQVWSEAGVSANIATRVNAANRANALFLRGDLLAALAAFESIDADTSASESPPARAARDLTHAKTLALLDRPEEAVALADAAVRAMCEHAGGLECPRARLATIDTRYYAGQPAQARAALDGLAEVFATTPPMLAVAVGFDRVLTLQLAPDDAALAAVIEQLGTNAKLGALQQRNAVRALLMLAEIFSRRGNSAYAQRLAQAAIDTAGDAIQGAGMDASLLLLWRARLVGDPVPGSALDALRGAVGPDHPLIAAHHDH